jgi:site-specific DNA-cytosine methylase
MNVLSLFDGMSCGRIALDRAGVIVDKYYASEVKKHAIKVSKDNYPDIIHLGDVTKLDCEYLKTLDIDLLIGGSPCQDFSILSKERLGLRGEKSSLFYQYFWILNEIKPKYFLLENVIMSKLQEEEITRFLNVEPVLINSSLVSGQNRERLYWSNIPNITIPKDRNITFSSIQEDVPLQDIKPFMNKKWGNKKRIDQIGKLSRDKAYCLTTGRTHPKMYYLNDDKTKCRLITRREAERLQTVPDGYTDSVGISDAINLLGDGWTVDVISHIFKGIKGDI